jgi:hypothetical protein
MAFPNSKSVKSSGSLKTSLRGAGTFSSGVTRLLGAEFAATGVGAGSKKSSALPVGLGAEIRAANESFASEKSTNGGLDGAGAGSLSCPGDTEKILAGPEGKREPPPEKIESKFSPLVGAMMELSSSSSLEHSNVGTNFFTGGLATRTGGAATRTGVGLTSSDGKKPSKGVVSFLGTGG